jgi:hypothetical protein
MVCSSFRRHNEYPGCPGGEALDECGEVKCSRDARATGNVRTGESPRPSEWIVADPEAIHMSEKSPYAANLCPLSVWVELACFREDFGESIGELIEAMLQSPVRQRTTEHLDGMLGEQ